MGIIRGIVNRVRTRSKETLDRSMYTGSERKRRRGRRRPRRKRDNMKYKTSLRAGRKRL